MYCTVTLVYCGDLILSLRLMCMHKCKTSLKIKLFYAPTVRGGGGIYITLVISKIVNFVIKVEKWGHLYPLDTFLVYIHVISLNKVFGKYANLRSCDDDSS